MQLGDNFQDCPVREYPALRFVSNLPGVAANDSVSGNIAISVHEVQQFQPPIGVGQVSCPIPLQQRPIATNSGRCRAEVRAGSRCYPRELRPAVAVHVLDRCTTRQASLMKFGHHTGADFIGDQEK
ncbi:hypothetical protein [Nocardia cyriacigeorgica]|uniref:hypothetical protein n=1 Tax=Nocardia cyriacigeorgica TaxID=135487 RepID=UPI001E613AFB|nr:hypothetical protein [Nocardia cyriacigeorgica]